LRRSSKPNALILIIAEAMADLVCSKDFSIVKARNGKTPPLLVLDDTNRRTAPHDCSSHARGVQKW
jgi:hypothetical protein